MAANDASGQGLQSAPKNRHQNNFSRKLWVKNPFSHFLFSCYTPFPTYDPHTILKNAPTRWTIIIFIFIYRTWKWAQMTRLVKGYNMRQRTGTKINFRESYDELTLVFWPKSPCFSRILIFIENKDLQLYTHTTVLYSWPSMSIIILILLLSRGV